MTFIDSVFEKARSNKKTIVLPEAYDLRTLEATAKILQKDVARVILIGEEAKIREMAGDWDISAATIIDPDKFADFEEFALALYEMRKAKGLDLSQARELLKNPLYLGVMLVKQGRADGMVAGAVNSTANTLRPALQILKTAPGTKLVSSFFLMEVPDCDFGNKGTFIFSDCGLVENPSAEDLSEIAISSAQSYKQLVGGEPEIAMLSYSSKGSAKSPLVDKVVEATALARAKAPELHIDGELQADAAIVPSVGKSKAASSPVAGQANVLIFPDLNAGNIGYKLVQRLAKAAAYGPVTQGIARPVNDLSRGCSADDIVGVVAITAVQAQA